MTSKHKNILELLVKAAKAGLNVLLEGPPGMGKTALITTVAAELGLRLKFFAAATLDPFVDLVGLPVPSTDEHGRKTLVYHRPADVAQAELVFFDDLNRAQPKTINAVFEMIQFHTINGERLPHLRAVFAACNPASAAHEVLELDPALIDRFHIYMTFQAGPDRDWFVARFGKDLGAALYDWWVSDLDRSQQCSVSPRKLEHIGLLIQQGIHLNAVSPEYNLPFDQLQARITDAEHVLDIKAFLAEPDRFSREVELHMNVAVRFAHLLPRMRPADMCKVRTITLSLPAELLATLRAQVPFVFAKSVEATRKALGDAEADAFSELIAERTASLHAAGTANAK